jgi:threonine 3-dehydrogenase
MKKMKALVKVKPGKGLWMEQVPVPDPGLNDVIIKVKKSAICGTDLHIYEWDPGSKDNQNTDGYWPRIYGSY